MQCPGKSSNAAPRGVTRRRVLGLVAACGLAPAFATDARHAAADMPVYRWRGRALGARAQITLAHPDAAAARGAVERCVAEITRLEAVFSLFQGESEISRLNRDGRLAGASLDFRTLLAEARRFGDLTGGAFDVTVQPLWQLYARHFATPGHGDRPPPDDAVAVAQSRIDFRHIDIAGAASGFLRTGMAVTLNGIAQGYITDRAASILRNEGFDWVLADLGEVIALDPPEGQSGWPVRIDHGEGSGTHDTMLLANRAIATSAPGGTRFDRPGRYHHLFDPRTGRSAAAHRAVSVIARSATVADAVSTALSILPSERAAGILRAAGADRAIFRSHAGSTVTVVA